VPQEIVGRFEGGRGRKPKSLKNRLKKSEEKYEVGAKAKERGMNLGAKILGVGGKDVYD